MGFIKMFSDKEDKKTGNSDEYYDIKTEDAYAEEGDVVGHRALQTFSYKVAKYVGAYMVAMNGVDAICFTAGVGENGPIVRDMVCNYLGFMGVELDDELNNKRGQDLIISKNENGPKIMVIGTNEELMIARDTYMLYQSKEKVKELA